MTRDEALHCFLEKHGWEAAHHTPLAADASFRTYDRLAQNGKTVILMNSPLSERPDRFVLVDSLLRKADIHAPQILAQDMEYGFLLLEDFGDDTFTKLLNKGTDEYTLYKAGIDTLIKMQQNISVPQNEISLYSAERFMNEALLLPNWFGKYAIAGGLSDTALSEFKSLWTKLITPLTQIPTSLVLLDYHADNLMMTPAGDCGVLDFQDARIGPVTYDLMSLLEDERRDVSSSVRQELIQHYFHSRPEVDTPLVRETLATIALQRHTKVIGIFVRLFMRDQKEKYLAMIPLIWELLERHLTNPVFSEYKDWINRYIPKSARELPLKPEDLK